MSHPRLDYRAVISGEATPTTRADIQRRRFEGGDSPPLPPIGRNEVVVTVDETPKMCPQGKHLMTAENSGPGKGNGKTWTYCRKCKRESENARQKARRREKREGRQP